jgi:hypothetical protein
MQMQKKQPDKESRFKYLSVEEFAALSHEQRVKYFQEALTSLKQGQGHKPDAPPATDKKRR